MAEDWIYWRQLKARGWGFRPPDHIKYQGHDPITGATADRWRVTDIERIEAMPEWSAYRRARDAETEAYCRYIDALHAIPGNAEWVRYQTSLPEELRA